MPSPAELIEKTGNLFSLPDVYFRVKSVLDDPDSGLADIAKQITTDPGLTARVLRIANSPLFGCVAEVATVDRAVNLLGMQQVHDLVLATSVTTAFASVSKEYIRMDTFWADSVYGGVVSSMLAVQCNVLDSDRLFVEGLLRDIGHLVMYQCIPKQTLQAKMFAAQEGTPLDQNEREIIGFDYAQVGAELIRSWKLPGSMCESVECHNNPGAATSYPLEVAIAHVSARTVDAVRNSNVAAAEDWKIDPLAMQVTGLTHEIVQQVAIRAEEHAADTLSTLAPKTAA